MATAIAPEEALTSNQLTSNQWAEAWWQRWQTAQTLVTESANSAVDTLTQAGETAKTTLLTATDQAIAKISDAATRAVTTINTTADRETQNLTDTAQQTATAIMETTDRAKASIAEITQTTLQAVERVNSATTQNIHRLTEATDQATIALNNRWYAGMEGTMIDAAQDAIASSVQTWLDAHPIIGWFIIHPLILIATVLIVIWLGWGLFRAIAQLSERLWIGLLRAPFQLMRLCWQLATRLLQRSSSEPQPSLPDEPNKQEKLATLLARLEAMRREQDELLKEVQMMLKD